MIRVIVVFMFFFMLASGMKSQDLFKPSKDSTVEVGIVEHLDRTIPLDVSFKNENDSTVVLRDLVNKPTILNFVYFDCPGICSPLLDGVSEVIETMDLELGKDYQVITISFNYQDNPEKARMKKNNFLRKHSQEHEGNWMYLTGDSASIYKVSNAVGFKFKRAGFDYIHAGAIIILSPKGKITRYLYGITFLPFDVKMAIIEAQKGLSRPASSKILEYCYAYDPQGKRYVIDVLKVSGSIIVFLLILFALLLMFLQKAKKNKQVEIEK